MQNRRSDVELRKPAEPVESYHAIDLRLKLVQETEHSLRFAENFDDNNMDVKVLNASIMVYYELNTLK